MDLIPAISKKDFFFTFFFLVVKKKKRYKIIYSMLTISNQFSGIT